MGIYPEKMVPEVGDLVPGAALRTPASHGNQPKSPAPGRLNRDRPVHRSARSPVAGRQDVCASTWKMSTKTVSRGPM